MPGEADVRAQRTEGGARTDRAGVGPLPWDLEPVLEVWVRPGGAEVTVVAAGRLDATTAERLAHTLEVAGSEALALVIDLSAVEQGSPPGWPVIDAGVNRLRRRGVAVGLVGDPRV